MTTSVTTTNDKLHPFERLIAERLLHFYLELRNCVPSSYVQNGFPVPTFPPTAMAPIGLPLLVRSTGIHLLLRVPRERKKENKKQEDLPEDQPLPGGQMLQKEGAHISKYKAKDTEDGKATKEGPSLGRTEPRKDAKDWKLLIPLGPVYPPLISSLSTSKAVRQHWDLSPPIAKSLRIHDGPFQHFLDMKAEKRLAGHKERRSRFGDIAVHKRYQFGQFFSPFQALATTEMKRLVSPRDLPLNSHLQKMSIPCTAEGSLQDLSLSSTELGVRNNDSNHEKEKSMSHTKTPLFPPIVKATKSKDMK
ncbi:uncharacterized protein LOC610995 isoform X1 [Canis lupus familiaris]|uniref:uncharacterized protein LOC610995 isoform X1 n=1 Tax=Canis lupus familiaris TaxID=9615 RepID=UPI0018F7926A|nr:uncharacterized protein LOC610995 isoform X1 [Canis lupus familiaris]